MYDHYISNFGRPAVPDDLCKDSATRHSWFWRRFLKVSTIYEHGGHLGQWTATVLAIFHSLAQGRLQMKFEQHWPRGFRREVICNSQHFFLYKSIGGMNWNMCFVRRHLSLGVAHIVLNLHFRCSKILRMYIE